MTRQDIVDLFNQLEVADFNFEHGENYSIYAKKNINLYNLLWLLELEEEPFSATENSVDVYPILCTNGIKFNKESLIFYIDQRRRDEQCMK